MAHIEFVYETHHQFVINQGDVVFNRAFPTHPGLYVIHNPQRAGRPVYVGTAINLKKRFHPRLEVLRECGFNRADLNNIDIYTVNTVWVAGQRRQTRRPGPGGVAHGVDVEHLLMRTYITKLGINTRNIMKANTPFAWQRQPRLEWKVTLKAGVAVGHLPPRPVTTYKLANGRQV